MTLTFVFRGRLKSCQRTIASHSPLNIPETVSDRGLIGFKEPPIENGLREIECSRDRWRHVTLKGQVVIPIRLKPNISKTVGDAIDSLLWGSTYRYPSDSLVSVLSCVCFCVFKMHHFFNYVAPLAAFQLWYSFISRRSRLCYNVASVVCLSSVTLCIVAKRCVRPRAKLTIGSL